MAFALESFASALGPGTVNTLAMTVGASPSAVSRALDTIGPLLLVGMSQMASAPGGAAALLDVLPRHSSPFGGFGMTMGGMFGGSAGPGGASILASVFGQTVSAVCGSLSRKMGFNVAPLLSLAAPAAMSAVAGMVRERNLDAESLASLLEREAHDFVTDPANRDTVAIVSAATTASEDAASLIAAYGADWTHVVAGPAAALFAVAGSDPSGSIGSMREAKAASDALTQAGLQAAPDSIVAAAFGAGLTMSMFATVKSLARSEDELVGVIRAGAIAVAARSPADSACYRDAILAVAQAAAEASKARGFFGFWGMGASRNEDARLDAIKRALG